MEKERKNGVNNTNAFLSLLNWLEEWKHEGGAKLLGTETQADPLSPSAGSTSDT